MKRKFLANLLLTTAIAIGVSTPVLAHGSEAKNTESIIESISPKPSSVAISIAAGDSFIVIKADKGHTVEIAGYSDEPYLRVRDDGTVEENQNSPAVVLNKSRLADVDSVTPDPSLQPEWVTIANDGEVAWHDHRIHWMSPSTPPTLDDAGTVQQWSVNLIVDGEEVVVEGRLVLLDSPSVMWWLVAAPFAALVFLAMRRRALSIAVLAAGIAVLLIDVARMRALPEVAQHTPTVGIAGGVAALLALVGLINRREKFADALLAGIGTAACLVSYTGISWMTNAVLPGVRYEWLARGSLAAIAGAGIAAVYSGVNGALKISQQ